MTESIRISVSIYLSIFRLCAVSEMLLQDWWLIVYRAGQSARKQEKPCGREGRSHPC